MVNNAPAVSTAQGPVLLIEDDLFITDLLVHELQRAGFQFDVAHNGTEGVEKFAAVQPRLLLLDLLLPDIHGFEALRQIRRMPGGMEVKVIVFSNIAEDAEDGESKRLGVDKYVVKANHTLQEVIAIIQELLKT